MGQVGTLDPPGRAMEGSDKVGAIYTFDHWVKIYNPAKIQPISSGWAIQARVCGVLLNILD